MSIMSHKPNNGQYFPYRRAIVNPDEITEREKNCFGHEFRYTHRYVY